jgi:hypothetical protein
MKKSFFYSTILAGMLLFTSATRAQQAKQTGASPKPPEAMGKVLQPDKTSATEPVVSPAIHEKTLPSTADLKTKVDMPKIIKGNELKQANSNQASPQPVQVTPRRTDNLTLPKSHQTEIPDSKSPPPPLRAGVN